MQPTMKLFIARKLFSWGERALRNAGQAEREDAVQRLRAAVARLEKSRRG